MYWIPFLTCSAVVVVFQAVVIMTALRSLCSTPTKTMWRTKDGRLSWCNISGSDEVEVPLTGKALANAHVDRATSMLYAACIMLLSGGSLWIPAAGGWPAVWVAALVVVGSPIFAIPTVGGICGAIDWFAWISGAGREATS